MWILLPEEILNVTNCTILIYRTDYKCTPQFMYAPKARKRAMTKLLLKKVLEGALPWFVQEWSHCRVV